MIRLGALKVDLLFDLRYIPSCPYLIYLARGTSTITFSLSVSQSLSYCVASCDFLGQVSTYKSTLFGFSPFFGSEDFYFYVVRKFFFFL